jgi:hypothetical protein
MGLIVFSQEPDQFLILTQTSIDDVVAKVKITESSVFNLTAHFFKN